MRGLNSKRCKSCQTLYQSAMKTRCAIAFSLLLPLAIAGAKDRRHCMVRLHLEANLHDTAAFATAVRAKFSGHDVAIEQMPRVSEEDVNAFYPYHAADGSYGALLQLNDHGRMMLEAL